MSGCGPRNDITDVPGVKVGQAHDERIRTGVTVILPDAPAIVGGDVRGGGPGTRETDLLDPSTLVDRADAIVLAGGSSYGLGAADGVAAWLGARGRGFRLVARDGVPPSPIVPAAILYDLGNGGDKNWGENPPYRQLGLAAAAAAAAAEGPVLLGRAGAGFGAIAGLEAGGLGSASFVTDDGFIVGAIVAVNSFGSVRRPGSRAFWAAPFEIGCEFGGPVPGAAIERGVADWPPDTKLGAAAPRANTTIGAIAVNAALTQAEARRLAIMAQDGLARAIRPAHGPTDGDALFALGAGPRAASDPLTLTRLGLIAADCVTRAIARAVYEAARLQS
ncbi:MAG TPA: peptidase T4 [Parvularcula sp.]|nr:peptidase T4 [Parvularcula sp.]HBS36247.1 peptidase T4 [Parvularcula sp.]